MGNCIENGGKSFVLEEHNIPGTSRQNLIFNTTNRQVDDYYEVLRVLGEGSMGRVTCVKKKEEAAGGSAYLSRTPSFLGFKTHLKKKKVPDVVKQSSETKLFALKSIILSRISRQFLDEIRNEIKILQTLDHPNIVKAYEVYETRVNIFLVLEHCSGGDLYSRLPYTEKESAKIVGKLLSALAYMHKLCVIHRDIKFENVMFESNHPDAEVKLIDFGLSTQYSPENKFMSEGVGTIYTMAPGVLKGVYTSQADLWSLGVVTFMLLSNTKPFFGKKRRHVVEKILAGKYSFYSSKWSSLTNESKDFVQSLICVDPKERLTADKALEHPWLGCQFPLSDRVPDEKVLDSVQEGITAFAEVNEFKKIALMVIAHQSTTEEILELRKAFDVYDSDNRGTISFEKFKAAMKRSSSTYSDEDIEKLFRSVDTGNDNEIHYMEFIAATLSVHGRINEERLAVAFDRLDSDDSGFISKENLKELLGKTWPQWKIQSMINSVDRDGDGKISFDDFMLLFQENNMKNVIELREDMSKETI